MSWSETYNVGTVRFAPGGGGGGGGGGATVFSSLGLLGGNLRATADYSSIRYYQNALLDSRGFGVAGTFTGGNSGVALDANGWPTVPTRLVVTNASDATHDGNLPAGTYHCSYQSSGQTTNVSITSSVNAAIINKVNLGDGLTTTFDLVMSGTPGNNQAMFDFSGPVQNLVIARTGAASSVTTGQLNPEALTYFKQFTCLRMMDFLQTNNSTVVTWANRTPFVPSFRGSLENAIDFCNAVYAEPGSKLKSAWINLPPQADDNFGLQAATLLNGRGNNSIQWIVEVGNEPWNFAFLQFGQNLDAGCAEIQAVSNYAQTTKLVSSVVRASNVTTVTLSTALPSYITNGASAVVWCDDGTFARGTVAAPITVTVTGSNTFTYPDVAADATLGATNFAAFFNITSNLVTDNTSAALWDMAPKYYVRRTFAIWNQWKTVRPQDKFVINLQMYGNNSYVGYDNFPPPHFKYAQFLGGGSATWLWGAAIAPYFTSGAQTVVANAITDLTNSLRNSVKYAMTAHIYQCVAYGLTPVAYEGGPDTQNTPTIQSSLHVDPAVGALVTEMLNNWYQQGGGLFNYFTLEPTAFTNVAQGAWTATQAYSDTTSPKLAALTSYLSGTPPTLVNQFGAPGTVDCTQYATRSVNGTTTNGLVGFFSPSTSAYYDYLIVVPTARTYTFQMFGTDSTTTSVVNLKIDGATIGSATLSNNGAFGTATTATASSTFTAPLSVGPHVLRIQIASGFSSPAFKQVVIT